MADYINRATKDIIVSLAGCAGFMDTLIGIENWRNRKKAIRSLKAALNHTLKALDAIREGLDTDQLEATIRTANCSYLSMIPHLSPNVGKEYYICPDDALEVLLGDALSDCAFCLLEGKQARRCKKRKALMQCGIVAKETGDCPYKG